jgi:hypothetical protein
MLLTVQPRNEILETVAIGMHNHCSSGCDVMRREAKHVTRRVMNMNV